MRIGSFSLFNQLVAAPMAGVTDKPFRALCRRLGAIWAYYEFGTVKISGHPEHTEEYIQGDRTLRTVRCRSCGCTIDWEPLQPEPGAKHGVNLRNFDPALLAATRIRNLDGADTWEYLD